MERITKKVMNTLSSVTHFQDSLLPSSVDVIVFCHLRWEFVFQRPQHIISRLAKNRRVLFVEEPIPYTPAEYGTAHIYQATENVTVIQPRVSWEKLENDLGKLVQRASKSLQMRQPIVWFYSAMFLPVLSAIDHSLVVYDCMDELSAFRGAPAELVKREKELLRMADVVFTGGKSLYESKKKQSSNVYCFPSSVDQKHFRKALSSLTSVPSDIAEIESPRVGFYGVIDERMDLRLVEKVATQLPSVAFILIGPVVKIDPATLPQRPNIHYLGQRSYEDLPRYLKAFDVAMMPFALNESTQFISPTKTLEFMAAERPIVSTPIFDVVRDYEKEVAIAHSPMEFTGAIANYLAETKKQQERRLLLQRKVLERTSWDRTVQDMKRILAEKLGYNPAEQRSGFTLAPANAGSVAVHLPT